jgi:hypothetical protein
MQGRGPNTSWLALIDVSAVPSRAVSQLVAHDLSDLQCEVNDSDGQWLVLSTANAPGEFDEVELEARIFRIIEALERSTGLSSSA